MFQTAQSHIPENSNDQFLCWRASLSVLERKYAIWSIFFKLSSISSHRTTESSTCHLWEFLCTLNMKEPTAPPNPCPFRFHCHVLRTLTVCLILLYLDSFYIVYWRDEIMKVIIMYFHDFPVTSFCLATCTLLSTSKFYDKE